MGHALTTPTPRAPDLDPDGCFLQGASVLATALSRVYGNTDDDLGRAIRRLAAECDRIRTGNCEFGAADWGTYLVTGGFPPDERLRRT